MTAIRQLGPGDEAVLELLAKEETDFDLDKRGVPLEPLNPTAAKLYLANPAVLHWVAFEKAEEGKGESVVGHLYCILLPLRSGTGHELLLYEIGVRSVWRKLGIGRTLLNHMEAWMRANSLETVWVLADNQVAVEFYRACGFEAETLQPLYMIREFP